MPGFSDPVPCVASDSCSWLPGVKPKVVSCSYSILRCSSTHLLGCKEWLWVAVAFLAVWTHLGILLRATKWFHIRGWVLWKSQINSFYITQTSPSPTTMHLFLKNRCWMWTSIEALELYHRDFMLCTAAATPSLADWIPVCIRGVHVGTGLYVSLTWQIVVTPMN